VHDGLRRQLASFVRSEAELPHRFQPRYLEKSFDPLELGGFAVTGRIDRIDVDPTSARGLVHDYKSTNAESAADVFEAMTMFPDYVAGTWSITTPLMESFHGELLAKEGAEGFYAMAASPELSSRLTERLRLPDDCTIGIALKIADGSMSRGRDPVVLRTLELLGVDPEELSPLSHFRQQPLRNHSGTLVGEVRAEFELEFL